ncbi:MAG: GNAT family N-acetyltransferase [Alphaproteobacteria bacterium]|nr:GNAT family N-acetyltransferase [Alphaproteobacteria bacterium]
MTDLTIRRATAEDLPAIVRMLVNDSLGKTRERYAEPLPGEYLRAFAEVEAQKGNEVLVAEADGRVIGCLQLTLIPGLTRLGMTRAQIEGVRVDETRRGEKIGERLFLAAIERARQAGCGLVQLTTDASRPDAHRFYERLGFVASHVGMKLALT